MAGCAAGLCTLLGIPQIATCWPDHGARLRAAQLQVGVVRASAVAWGSGLVSHGVYTALHARNRHIHSSPASTLGHERVAFA